MKKLKLISIVLSAVLIGILFCGCGKEQPPPKIEYGEFPFRFVYELNGERFEIDDTVVCEFSGFDSSGLFSKPRVWREYLKNEDDKQIARILILEDKNVVPINIWDNYVIVGKPKAKVVDEIEVYLNFGMGEYYMGDPNAKSMPHGEPSIVYSEMYEIGNEVHYYSMPISAKDAEKYFGIKVVEFNFSKPIKNTFK